MIIIFIPLLGLFLYLKTEQLSNNIEMVSSKPVKDLYHACILFVLGMPAALNCVIKFFA